MTTEPAKGPRKRLPRGKGKRKRSDLSSKLKILWQTPEFREKMRQRDINRIAAARANPAKFTRAGVPTGMKRADAEPLWQRARELADQFIRIMQDKGELPEDEVVLVQTEEEVHEVRVPQTDDGKATAALREAFVLAVGPSDQKIKIQAINTVLNFTKSKPESKSKLTLTKAEDFLSEIAGED